MSSVSVLLVMRYQPLTDRQQIGLFIGRFRQPSVPPAIDHRMIEAHEALVETGVRLAFILLQPLKFLVVARHDAQDCPQSPPFTLVIPFLCSIEMSNPDPLAGAELRKET
jgi:hypothetical protein